MTVAELIEELKKYPQDMAVYAEFDACGNIYGKEPRVGYADHTPENDWSIGADIYPEYYYKSKTQKDFPDNRRKVVSIG